MLVYWIETAAGTRCFNKQRVQLVLDEPLQRLQLALDDSLDRVQLALDVPFDRECIWHYAMTNCSWHSLSH